MELKTPYPRRRITIMLWQWHLLALLTFIAAVPSLMLLAEDVGLVQPIGLQLEVIVVTHDLTPQAIEQHHRFPVESPAAAVAKCSAYQEQESKLTNEQWKAWHPEIRGRTSVRCLLIHPDGTRAQLVEQLRVP